MTVVTANERIAMYLKDLKRRAIDLGASDVKEVTGLPAGGFGYDRIIQIPGFEDLWYIVQWRDDFYIAGPAFCHADHPERATNNTRIAFCEAGPICDLEVAFATFHLLAPRRLNGN